jgi:hypothetical protein
MRISRAASLHVTAPPMRAASRSKSMKARAAFRIVEAIGEGDPGDGGELLDD